MDTDQATNTKSPCVDVCRLDEQDICLGCGRSLDEVGDWLLSNEAERAAIVKRAAERLTQMTAAKAQSS